MEDGFGGATDYALFVKLYWSVAGNTSDARYSLGECIGTRTEVMSGSPLSNFIGTSYVERQNPTMRMRMRRFTRLTNAFSKKPAILEHAIALHYMHYNIGRRHQS